MGGWILLGAGVLLASYVIALFNGLVRLRNRFQNAFSQIDVQLKRRHDLIPNLVQSPSAIWTTKQRRASGAAPKCGGGPPRRPR